MRPKNLLPKCRVVVYLRCKPLKIETEPIPVTILFVNTYSYCSKGSFESVSSSGIRVFRMSRTAGSDRLQGPLDLVF